MVNLGNLSVNLPDGAANSLVARIQDISGDVVFRDGDGGGYAAVTDIAIGSMIEDIKK